jgi:acetoin utilization protein AcuB
MLVKNWMSRNVITVDADDPMTKAINLMKEHKINRLPVMKKGELVGIVTDGDIKRASASDATALEIHELLYLISKIAVAEIMTPRPTTVPPDYTVEEVAMILKEKGISGAPVTDQGRLVGVITQNDLFDVLISLTGMGKRGVQFAFRLEDRPGSIREVTDVIREFGGKVLSLLSTSDRVPEGYREVFVRAHNIDRDRLEELREALEAKAQLRYLVDHVSGAREVYATD